MSVNKLPNLLHFRVFLLFLLITRGSDYPEKYISQPSQINVNILYL